MIKQESVGGLLHRGAETIFLEASMPQGELQFGASQWTVGDDRAFVARGQMGDWTFYRGLFSQGNDETVFARMQDGDASTLLQLGNGGDGIMNVTVSHNEGLPKSYRVDVADLMASRKLPKSINGEEIDFVGNRKPPTFSPMNLYEAVKGSEDFNHFRRGTIPDFARSAPAGGGSGLSKCALICLVPACGIFCLFWFKKDKNKDKTEKFAPLMGAFPV